MNTKLKAILVAVVAVVAGLVAAWKLGPDRRSPEQQILEDLVAIQKAVQEKDLRGTMGHISESYRDPDTGNKRELTRLVIGGFREQGDFEVVLQPERPVVAGPNATVDVRVDFAIIRGGTPHRVPPFVVHTRWAREKRAWKITWADGYWDASGAFEEAGL